MRILNFRLQRHGLEFSAARDGSLMERRCGSMRSFPLKNLSAGERQRLAFARVLLKRPRYVLLDWATNALNRDNAGVPHERLFEQLGSLRVHRESDPTLSRIQ